MIKQFEMIDMLQFAIDKIKNESQDDYVVEHKINRVEQTPYYEAFDCSISFHYKEVKPLKNVLK